MLRFNTVDCQIPWQLVEQLGWLPVILQYIGLSSYFVYLLVMIKSGLNFPKNILEI